MVVLNEDKSIYLTRGDAVTFPVSYEGYTFQPGDVVRFKVYGKKDAKNVVLQKDFGVTEECTEVEISLTSADTKIGEVISKPKDYWYEVELNPFDKADTFIGYGVEGAMVFKLFPEGDDVPEFVVEPEDIPVVDKELDMTSTRPVQNQAIARAVTSLRAKTDKAADELVVEKARLDNLVAGGTADGSEVVDIRVGADGITYGSAGTAVREQMKKVNGNIKDLAASFELSGNSNAYNYRLMSVDYKAGDRLHFLVRGVRCNIICVTASEGKAILVNQAVASDVPYEVVLTEDIVSLGIYMLESGIGKVYVIGDFLQSTYDVLRNNVSGETIFTSDKTELNSGLLFRIVDGKVTRNNYASGNCAKCNVESTSKAIISGFGWDSNYDYFLYAFADGDNNVLLLGTDDNASVTDLELDVPEGAVSLFVNGRIDYTDASIKVLSTSTNFEELYRYYSGGNTRKPKLITLGDSITALGTGSRGWLKYFLEKTKFDLVANVAVDGAVLSDYSGTVYDGNPTITTQKHNVLGNQVQKIADNGYEAPDIIMIAIGTNGGIDIAKEDIRAAYYNASNKLIPLEDVDRTTDAGAYRYCTETLHNLYPDAIIFWCSPIMGFQAIRSAENAVAYSESLRIATEYSGQILIDSIRCGINGVNEFSGANGEYLIDGLHPNAKGAKKLGYYNASIVKGFM